MQIAKSIFFLAILCSTGCGPNPSLTAVPLKAVQSDRKDPIPQATDIQINAAQNGHLTCEFNGECEPAIALISVATGTGVSRCTGFLISDHEVLTNDHCLSSIPDDEEKACQGLVFAHFTQNVHRSCKKITVRSHQNGVNSKDYALIELTEPVRDRNALRLSKRGFKNNEVTTIFRVQTLQNPITHTYDGMQTKLNCHASYSTIMNINVKSSKVPVMTFGDCSIQEGNSGSPMINENGEVGAINQGFLSVKEDSFSDLLNPYLLDQSYGEVAIGTQTRCMPELVGFIGNNCEALKPLDALYPKEFIAEFGIFSASVLPKQSASLLWKEVSSPSLTMKTFISIPSCISKREAHSNNFSFTSSVMTYQQGINSRLQAEWRPLFREGEREFLLTVQKNLADQASTVDFITQEFGTITLPICNR